MLDETKKDDFEMELNVSTRKISRNSVSET